ncbi:MAG TPA: nucleoside recognition domain-containing protein [Clostridia bacterium]|jgi:spore maturation protein SpmB|nr:nucleoside recognition domain-containing protein [Clostridia bacterium]
MITRQTVVRGGNKAVKIVVSLLKFIIPSIFIMKVLEHSGLLYKVAEFFAPVMAFMGLPGESALVFLFGQVTIYSGIATMAVLDFTAKQVTIMSTVLCIFHVVMLESAVISKSGANALLNAAFRFIAALFTGLVLNFIIPGV